MLPGYISPLELFHPNGIAKRSIVLGHNCPRALQPYSAHVPPEPADLAILAPTRAEYQTSGWLEDGVRTVAQQLASDGIVYAFVPCSLRLKLAGLLRQQGLALGPWVAHLPNWGMSRHLVPLKLIPAGYTFAKLLPTRPRRRQLLMLALRLPCSSGLLASVLPSVALVARRPDARALFTWLFQLDDKRCHLGNAVISARWRAHTGTAVLHRFANREAFPSAIAKLSLTATPAVDSGSEVEVIRRLGPSARLAGARVPHPLVIGQLDSHPVLLQTALSGQSAASLLIAQPKRLLALVECVVRWLEDWNHRTMIIRPLERARLCQAVLSPATLLAPLLEQGKAYCEWLSMRCATAEGVSIPFVAAHGDLTMSNVLIDGQGHLGVIDWETGHSEGLPLTDFFYAVADAAAATKGYQERPKAFMTCFAPGGSLMDAVRDLQMHARRSLSLSADLADLCFHACWLRHAAHEYRSDTSDRKRFLNIVQILALHRSSTYQWLNG